MVASARSVSFARLVIWPDGSSIRVSDEVLYPSFSLLGQ